MNILKLIFYSIAAFVERNPIFCTVMLVCAIAAPWLFKSVITVILYIVLAFLIVGLIMFGTMAWRIRSMSKQAQERFKETGRSGDGQRGRTSSWNASWGGFRREDKREGEVRVHRTERAGRKRVSDEVGDYVDFEEIEQKDKK